MKNTFGKRRLPHIKATIVLAVIVVTAVLLASTSGVFATEPDFSIEAQPTDDVLASGAFGSFDDSNLYTSSSGFPTEGPSGFAILKFELATGGIAIERARLNVAAIACDGDGQGNVTVRGLLSAQDGWSEASPPTFITIRDNLDPVLTAVNVDEGTVDGPGDGEEGAYYHWTDNDTGTSGLAEWLEQQRLGDGTATLVLQLEGISENQVAFSDRELTAGCETSQGPPILQLAGADDPLNVTLSNLTADNTQPVNYALYAGLAALAVLGIGAVGYGYSRTR